MDMPFIDTPLRIEARPLSVDLTVFLQSVRTVLILSYVLIITYVVIITS